MDDVDSIRASHEGPRRLSLISPISLSRSRSSPPGRKGKGEGRKGLTLNLTPTSHRETHSSPRLSLLLPRSILFALAVLAFARLGALARIALAEFAFTRLGARARTRRLGGPILTEVCYFQRFVT